MISELFAKYQFAAIHTADVFSSSFFQCRVEFSAAFLGEFRVGGGVHDSYTCIPVQTGGVFYFLWYSKVAQLEFKKTRRFRVVAKQVNSTRAKYSESRKCNGVGRGNSRTEEKKCIDSCKNLFFSRKIPRVDYDRRV